MPTEIDRQYEIAKKRTNDWIAVAGEENLRHTNIHKLLNGHGTNNEPVHSNAQSVYTYKQIHIKTTY